MSQTATATKQAHDPFSPTSLSNGRKVEWHLRVADHDNSVVGIDIRYSEGIELPGILSINRKLAGGIDLPKNVFNPGVTDQQAAKDAIEILGQPGLKEQAEKIALSLIKDLEAFASEVRGRFLN